MIFYAVGNSAGTLAAHYVVSVNFFFHHTPEEFLSSEHTDTTALLSYAWSYSYPTFWCANNL